MRKFIPISLLMLIISAFSACTNYDPWLKVGFTPEQADHWLELKFTATEASKWDEYGFTPAISLKWRSKGFNAQEAGGWKQAGFNLREALLWKSEIFSAIASKQWKDNGYHLDQAKSWKRAGFDASTSKQWEEKGYDLKSAQAWKLAGFNLEKANHWKSQGYSLKEAKNYIEWQRENFSIKEADEWMVVEPDVHKAKQWRESGLSTTQVDKAKKHGLTVSEYAQWQAMGFGLEKLLEVKQKGLSVSEVKTWTQAGLSVEQAIRAKASGFQLGEASAWKKEGYSIEQAIDAKSQGLTLESIQKGHRLTKLVITKGVGATEKEAVVDAGRSAVKQTVGTYLVSETLMQNDELIKDEVLSYSNGYVEGFEMLSSQKTEDGLVEVIASVRVAYKRLQTKLGNLNLSLKDMGSVAFKAVEYDKFSAAREFKSLFSKVVTQPLIKKNVYEVNLLEFRPARGNLNYLIKDRGMSWLGKDGERASFGELFPYILTYELRLSPNYLASVKDFFEAVSEEKLDTEPFTPHNGNFGDCGRKSNTCLQARRTLNQTDCSSFNEYCVNSQIILEQPVCRDGGREFNGNWIMLGESKFFGDPKYWENPEKAIGDCRKKAKSARDYSNTCDYIMEISSKSVEWGIHSNSYRFHRPIAWEKLSYYKNHSSYRFSDIQGNIINALFKRDLGYGGHLYFTLDLFNKKGRSFKQKSYGGNMEHSGWSYDGGKSDTLSATRPKPSLPHEKGRLLGWFESGSYSGFGFISGYTTTNCLGNGVQALFFENNWQFSIILWLDENDVESLSEITIRPWIKTRN